MKLVPLKSVTDHRGTLTVLESQPFDVKRVYFLHRIATGASRGGHAHRECRRVYIPVAGSFRVTSDESSQVMSDPSFGLLVEPMEWVTVSEFSPSAACLILASHEYDEAEVIRSRAEFEKLRT